MVTVTVVNHRVSSLFHRLRGALRGMGFQPTRHKLGGMGEIGLRLGRDVGKRLDRDSTNRTGLRGTIGLEDAEKRVMATRVLGTVIEA